MAEICSLVHCSSVIAEQCFFAIVVSKIYCDIRGKRIASPTLKGSTGMGEIGLSFRPVKDSGLSLDLGLQGYTGVREGVSGSFQVKWEF